MFQLSGFSIVETNGMCESLRRGKKRWCSIQYTTIVQGHSGKTVSNCSGSYGAVLHTRHGQVYVKQQRFVRDRRDETIAPYSFLKDTLLCFIVCLRPPGQGVLTPILNLLYPHVRQAAKPC